MDDAPLVGVERSELLVHARLLHFLGEKLRHLAKLDVLALAVGERVDEHAPVVGQPAAERHVDDVLERLERLAAVSHEQLRFFAGQIDPRAVGGLLDVHGGVDPHRFGDPGQKIDNGLGPVRHVNPPARRRSCRSRRA